MYDKSSPILVVKDPLEILVYLCATERCELHFFGQILLLVLKHPDTVPISCFVLHKSSLLEVIVNWYLLWIVHKFSLHQRLYLAAASFGTLFHRATSTRRVKGTERKYKACIQLVPSHPKTGPTFPLGEHKAAAAITQLDFSGTTSFTVVFWGEWEGSHRPEFKGSGPSGWEVLELYKELAIDGILYSHSFFQVSGLEKI